MRTNRLLFRTQEKLEEFIGAANSGDNCHLVTIPAGVLPSDVLISSPIVSGEGAVGAGGGGLGGAGGGDFGGVADFAGEDFLLGCGTMKYVSVKPFWCLRFDFCLG